jgi:hypothetical protein
MQELSALKLLLVEVCTCKSLKNVRVVKNSCKEKIGYQHRFPIQDKLEMMRYAIQTQERKGKYTTAHEEK